jgi:hypothetical protein
LRLHFWSFQNRFQEFSEDVQDKFTMSVAVATNVVQHRVKINSILEKQAQSLTTTINVDFGVRVPANNPAKVSCVIVCVLFDCVFPLIRARSVTDRYLALNLISSHIWLCPVSHHRCCLQHIFGCGTCVADFGIVQTGCIYSHCDDSGHAQHSF